MSMPFMWGTAPSSLTVPVILPSPAALTFWPRISAPQQMRATADKTAADLKCFLIEISPLYPTNWSNPLALLLACWGIWIHWLQSKLFRHLFFLALLSHKRAQIEHQIPSLIRFDIVGKRRHRSAIQAGHEDSVNVLVGVAEFGAGPARKFEARNRAPKIVGRGSADGPLAIPCTPWHFQHC